MPTAHRSQRKNNPAKRCAQFGTAVHRHGRGVVAKHEKMASAHHPSSDGMWKDL